MPDALQQYRQLERRLWMARFRNHGEESPAEDAVLDEMDEVWSNLTESERDLLKSEGPRCWPEDFSSGPEISGVGFGATSTTWNYEGFHSPEETIADEDVA